MRFQRLRSIRWQLLGSYATIAVLSLLLLTTMLLGTLGDYYMQQELAYLEQNAESVDTALTTMLALRAPLPVLRSHIASYAFLSQTRMRLSDANGLLLADSGSPRRNTLLSVGANPQAVQVERSPDVVESEEGFINLEQFRTSMRMPIEIALDDGTGTDSTMSYYTPIISLDFVRFFPNVTAPLPASPEEPSSDAAPYRYTLPTSSTLFGFELNPDSSISSNRSPQIVKRALTDQAGRTIALLEISEGPASGGQIVARVANSLLVAGLFTIGLAGAAGWIMSLRLTAPIVVLTATTARMAEGELTARVTLLRQDELGQLATAFNYMAHRVESMIVNLRRFVADAAHELQTPLTALHTNLELALEEDTWVTRRAFLERAQAQLKRLESLTDGLLNLSRIEGGSAIDTQTNVPLSALLQDVSEIYASRSEQAAITFILNMPPEAVFVQGNSGQIRSALSNLLDNAIKFSPPGAIVNVTLHKLERYAEVLVDDRGIGIPHEEIPYLFDRFHRCRNAAGYPGSGLGLAIVRGVAEAHRGRISVETLNPGTRFTLSLPLVPAQAQGGLPRAELPYEVRP